MNKKILRFFKWSSLRVLYGMCKKKINDEKDQVISDREEISLFIRGLKLQKKKKIWSRLILITYLWPSTCLMDLFVLGLADHD